MSEIIKYSKVKAIMNRRNIVKKLLETGKYSTADITKYLEKYKNGDYKASFVTIQKDIAAIGKEKKKWDLLNNPAITELHQKKRMESIAELEDLIDLAKRRCDYRTAGELISRKSRLEGIDKYIAPKEKTEDSIEKKYSGKTEKEINEIILKEFKLIFGTLKTKVLKNNLNNIKNIKLFIIREINGKEIHFKLNIYGEECEINQIRTNQ